MSDLRVSTRRTVETGDWVFIDNSVYCVTAPYAGRGVAELDPSNLNGVPLSDVCKYYCCTPSELRSLRTLVILG